jgi:DNA-binding MarR family transcriptional regulator
MPKSGVAGHRKRTSGKGAAVRSPSRGARIARSSADAVMASEVLQQFRELFRVSQRHFQRIEASCGVSGAQLWALSELSRRPGQTISELARALSIHLSTSSNLLDKLEKQSLVRRERRSEDQRLVRVYVTAAGRRLLARAPKPAEGVIPDALAKLPGTAVRRLRRDLKALLEHASSRSARDAMKPLAEP